MESNFIDKPGMDLTVYEYTGSKDGYTVDVSLDTSTYYFVGESGGGETSFELSGVGSGGPFRYVRIVDTSYSNDGADIDAVHANHQIPEPSTVIVWSLLAMLGAGVGLGRRRRGR